MDRTTASNDLVPSTLLVGPIDTVKTEMLTYTQRMYRTSTGRDPEVLWGASHPSLRWILPGERAYRRADLEPFFDEVYRSRTANSPVFYLFPQAELLNESCANSMLKVLEEPPQATYFLLGAPCADFVLPTIVSRCLVVSVGGETSPLVSTIVAHFMQKTTQSYAQFMKIIEAEEIDERKTRLLVDQLFSQFHILFRDAVLSGNEVERLRSERALRVLTYAYDRLPMPGSTKTFWRTIYLLMG